MVYSMVWVSTWRSPFWSGWSSLRGGPGDQRPSIAWRLPPQRLEMDLTRNPSCFFRAAREWAVVLHGPASPRPLPQLPASRPCRVCR